VLSTAGRSLLAIRVRIRGGGQGGSGEEGIEYVKKHPVDPMILDMVMPKEINGRETYEQIGKIHPGQKAIVASRYAKTEEVNAAQECCHFLRPINQ
jgi:DNA-binding NarL/FixJ family response regulator